MTVSDKLWSGRAVTEHKYVFGFFVCFFVHVSLYASNHFNHCIKLFAPCGTLIGNKNSYSYSYNLFLLFFLESLGIKKNKTNAAAETIHNNLFM
jgi:hypothetical protein